MTQPLKRLDQLAALRQQLADRARAAEQSATARRAQLARAEAHQREFADAVKDAQPLAPHGRHLPRPTRPLPHPQQRWRDDAAALHASLSDEIDVDTLLDTDDGLSFARPGVGADVVRRLRRGRWVIQGQIDLHGHRVDEARHALVAFLREALKHNRRCVRVVHGKGLGSRDRVPVLKLKVRAWLAQRDEVIAFCQARGDEGGSGALVVLLRPTGNAGA